MANTALNTARKKPSNNKASSTNPSKLGLKVAAGLNMGTIYPLKKRRNIIGRRMDASFPVQDERVSRDHATVEFKKGHFIVNDLESTNGTFLNNKALSSPTFIKAGDQIRVGSSVFVVEEMNKKSAEVVQKWSSNTMIIPRKEILAKVKETLPKPSGMNLSERAPRWKHLTQSFEVTRQKHLYQARLVGLALGALVVCAAIIISL